MRDRLSNSIRGAIAAGMLMAGTGGIQSTLPVKETLKTAVITAAGTSPDCLAMARNIDPDEIGQVGLRTYVDNTAHYLKTIVGIQKCPHVELETSAGLEALKALQITDLTIETISGAHGIHYKIYYLPEHLRNDSEVNRLFGNSEINHLTHEPSFLRGAVAIEPTFSSGAHIYIGPEAVAGQAQGTVWGTIVLNAAYPPYTEESHTGDKLDDRVGKALKSGAIGRDASRGEIGDVYYLSNMADGTIKLLQFPQQRDEILAARTSVMMMWSYPIIDGDIKLPPYVEGTLKQGQIAEETYGPLALFLSGQDGKARLKLVSKFLPLLNQHLFNQIVLGDGKTTSIASGDVRDLAMESIYGALLNPQDPGKPIAKEDTYDQSGLGNIALYLISDQ